MAYLKFHEWPKGAKKCPTCSTGFFREPYTRCYLCNHPEKRLGSFTLDREEDADFGHALGLDWGRD